MVVLVRLRWTWRVRRLFARSRSFSICCWGRGVNFSLDLKQLKNYRCCQVAARFEEPRLSSTRGSVRMEEPSQQAASILPPMQSNGSDSMSLTPTVGASERSSADDCVICRELLRTSALSLTCGHVFCALCVVKLVGKGMRTCPVCRACIDLYNIKYATDSSPASVKSYAAPADSTKHCLREITVPPWEAHQLSSWYTSSTAAPCSSSSAMGPTSPTISASRPLTTPNSRSSVPNAFNRSVSVFNKGSLSATSFKAGSASMTSRYSTESTAFHQRQSAEQYSAGLEPCQGASNSRNSFSTGPARARNEGRRNSLSSFSMGRAQSIHRMSLSGSHGVRSSLQEEGLPMGSSKSRASQEDCFLSNQGGSHDGAEVSSLHREAPGAQGKRGSSCDTDNSHCAHAVFPTECSRATKSPRSSVDAASPRGSLDATFPHRSKGAEERGRATKSPRSSGEFNTHSIETATIEEAVAASNAAVGHLEAALPDQSHCVQHHNTEGTSRHHGKVNFHLGEKLSGARAMLSSKFHKRHSDK